jgi:hypothetical protein
MATLHAYTCKSWVHICRHFVDMDIARCNNGQHHHWVPLEWLLWLLPVAQKAYMYATTTFVFGTLALLGPCCYLSTLAGMYLFNQIMALQVVCLMPM